MTKQLQILFRVTLNQGVRRARKVFGSRAAPAWREHRSSASVVVVRGRIATRPSAYGVTGLVLEDALNNIKNIYEYR